MSLKAGRVGVNPADVDPIDGHINPSSLEGYTKEEADAKFETQEAAAALQPKTLAVPISMLQGSLLVPKTTVEDVIQTMDNAMTNRELTEAVTVQESAVTDIVSGAEVTTEEIGNHLLKQGNMVTIVLSLKDVTNTAWSGVMFKIPEGFRPKYSVRVPIINRTGEFAQIGTNGIVQFSADHTTQRIIISGASWITE